MSVHFINFGQKKKMLHFEWKERIDIDIAKLSTSRKMQSIKVTYPCCKFGFQYAFNESDNNIWEWRSVQNMHSFKANIVAILWGEKFQTIRFFLSVYVCVCVCVCVYIYIYIYIYTEWPKKIYTHFVYTNIYTAFRSSNDNLAPAMLGHCLND
jgi:hypothetical protein